MSCFGADYEMCGGPNRLNVYAFNTTKLPTKASSTSSLASSTATSATQATSSVAATSGSASTGTQTSVATSGTSGAVSATGTAADGNNTNTPSASATTSTAATTSSAAPTPSGLNATAILPWKYQGCYTDTGNGRSLTGNSPGDSQNNTIENCISACSANGYALAGLQWSQQ